MRAKLLLALSSFLIISCGSSGGGLSTVTGSTGGGSALPFTGIFYGTQTGTQGDTPFSQTVTLILTQVGSNVTGTWNTGSGSAGTVTGIAAGNTLNQFTITSGGACAGDGGGHASLSTDSFTGFVSGTFGACGVLNAVFSLTKQ